MENLLRAKCAVENYKCGMDAWRIRLKERIAEKGKNNRSVSIEIGADPSYLYKILKRGSEPTIDKMVALADALDVSLSWLLYGYELGPTEEELLRLYANLPDRQRRALLDLASGLQPRDAE